MSALLMGVNRAYPYAKGKQSSHGQFQQRSGVWQSLFMLFALEEQLIGITLSGVYLVTLLVVTFYYQSYLYNRIYHRWRDPRTLMLATCEHTSAGLCVQIIQFHQVKYPLLCNDVNYRLVHFYPPLTQMSVFGRLFVRDFVYVFVHSEQCVNNLNLSFEC